MFLKRGITNNKDPATIYTKIKDLDRYFGTIKVEGSGVGAAEKLSPVAAAHRIFTGDMSVMPWMIRQKVGEARTEPSHAIEAVLKIRANEAMSPSLADKIIMSQAFWHGAGFAYIGRDPMGHVQEIIPLPSSGYTRLRDQSTGAIWYAFQVDSDTPGAEKLQRRFQPSELLIHYFETYDGISGRGVLDLGRDAIFQDKLAQKYGAKFYQNGARVSGFVEVPVALSDPARDRVREDFERIATGMDNAFRVSVLDAGMKYTPLGISQKDSQYIESRSFSVEEIARFTGIPTYMLQTGKQSYQSNEQQQLDFITNTLLPHIVRQEQEWSYKLLSGKELQSGYYLKRNVASLLRGDNKSRAEFYQRMIGMGVYNQDYCRSLEDLSPVPDGLGESYWMSKNYNTIQNMQKGGS